MKKGILLVISGPSGVGKGTITQQLMEKYPDLSFSLSMTTRQPREGEKEGVNYYFTDVETFEKMISENKFIEYAKVHGNYYGTPRDMVEQSLRKGQSILLDIDIQGALQVKKRYPKGIYIFILPPSMRELKNRLLKRGSETQKTFQMRYDNAFKELDLVVAYDYYIINDELEKAVDTLDIILRAERQRVNEQLLAFIRDIKEN